MHRANSVHRKAFLAASLWAGSLGASDPWAFGDGSILEFQLPAYHLESTPQGVKPVVADWARTTDVGRADLPVTGRLLTIPRETKPQLHIQILEELQLPFPNAARTLSREEHSRAQELTDPREGSPESVARLEWVGRMKGQDLWRLLIQPFQWEEGQLRIIKRMKIQIQCSINLSPTLSLDWKANKSEIALKPLPQPLERPPFSFRMDIPQSGWYRVAYEDLPIPSESGYFYRPGEMRLNRGGKEIPCKVTAKNSRIFGPGDFVEFYAENLDTFQADAQIYWLSWERGKGARIQEESAPSPHGDAFLTSFKDLLRFEQNQVIWTRTPGAPQKDYWFWKMMTAPHEETILLNLPPLDTKASATLKVHWQGRTTATPHPNHRTLIGLNDQWLSTANWDGDTLFTQEIQVPPDLLKSGENRLMIHLPGDTGAVVDQVYLNDVEIEVQRLFQSKDNALSFTVESQGNVHIKGFSRDTIQLLNLSQKDSPKLLQSTILPDGRGAYELHFLHSSQQPSQFLATAQDPLKPSRLELRWDPMIKASPTGADLLMLAPMEFLPSLMPLALRRYSQGLRVWMVAVEDLYDSFSHGLEDPQALKDFISQVYHHGERPAPSFVLLLGDSTYDPRRWLVDSVKSSMIPLHWGVIPEQILAPDDNWLVCVDGEDDLPDLVVGRIPAATAEEAARTIQKILGSETGTVPDRALFVADNNESSFATVCERLMTLLPKGINPRRIYLAQYTSFTQASQDILSALTEGMTLVSYVGHGDSLNWAGERVLTPELIQQLQPSGRTSFVLTLNCQNGYFALPNRYCITEELLAAPQKGAYAAFSSSGLGYTWEHELLANELLSTLFKGNPRSLGEACIQAKVKAYGRGATLDQVKTFTFFGDPSMPWKKPAGNP